MAIDTQNKRRAVINFGVPFICAQPVADGSIGEEDRRIVVNCSFVPSEVEVTFLWDFGDGTTSTEQNPGKHLYRVPGDYTVTLTVTDALGNTDTHTEIVTATGVDQADLFYMGGDGEAWFADYFDRTYIVNGSGNCKVERDGSAYRIGIAAPTSVTSQALAGGSLDEGTWKGYVSYCRKIGNDIFYSQGYQIDDVTIDSTNKTVRILLPASSDLQVTHYAVFLSGPNDSSVYYRYAFVEQIAGDNGVDIEDDSNKQTSIIYDVVAAQSGLPPEGGEYIVAQDNRLWISKENVVYYSLKYDTPFELERFPQLNFYKLPYQITGMFTIGADLFFNTPAGIIKLIEANTNQRYSHTEKRHNFEYFRTVQNIDINVPGVIGLTGDGVRFFDGNGMSRDLSLDVKPEIETLYNSWGVNNRPCGAVIRRNFRTEYHLGYKDNDVSARTNNLRLVLNVDRIAEFEGGKIRAPWEIWTNGSNYFDVDNDGNLYACQSRSDKSTIYVQDSSTSNDRGIYVGDDYSIDLTPSWKVVSRSDIPDIMAREQWEMIYLFLTNKRPMTVTVNPIVYRSTAKSKTSNPIANPSLFGVARFGISRFTPESPVRRKLKLPRSTKGWALFVTWENVWDDPDMELMSTELIGTLKAMRKT